MIFIYGIHSQIYLPFSQSFLKILVQKQPYHNIFPFRMPIFLLQNSYKFPIFHLVLLGIFFTSHKLQNYKYAELDQNPLFYIKPIIKILMFRTVLLFVLSYVVMSSIFISPAYPPTAYQNQFYSVRFRIRGVDFPIYNFKGLPNGLKSTAEGEIQGVPTVAGSFSVKLSYIAGNQTGTKDFIFKVTADILTKKNDSVSATQTGSGLVISYPNNLIFRVGQKINLKLQAQQGAGPYLWAFLNLPQGLTSNINTGQLQGYLKQAGYYNLNVQVADKNGNSASAFLTINAQPAASLQTNKIVQVQVQNTSSRVNLKQIENQQVQADNALFKALELVKSNKSAVNSTKENLAFYTVKVQNANNSFNQADLLYNSAADNKTFSQVQLTATLNTLNAAQKNLQLALTEGTSSSARIQQVRKNVQTATKRFNQAQKAVSTAEIALVEAKDKYSKSQSALRDANTLKTSSLEQYKRAVTALEDSKKVLQDARKRKQISDLAVKQAQDTLQLSLQARDNAQNDLKKADVNLATLQKTLDAALSKLSTIRQKYTKAKSQYESQKWDYQMRINQLYVAQARKQAADRASAIAIAEGSLSDHNLGSSVNVIGKNSVTNSSSSPSASSSTSSTTTTKFAGCDSLNYPVIAGTSQVRNVSSNGYTLSSGHQVIYGGCSTRTNDLKVGDWVSYNGFIVNSVLNAVRIQRVLLS